MTQQTKIIAEYYNVTAAVKRANPGVIGKLEIIKLGGSLMPREIMTSFYVEGRIHARRLALAHDATPWNF